MDWLHVMILLPFLFAALVPIAHRMLKSRIHAGWFVLTVPVLLFLYFLQYIPAIAGGSTFSDAAAWIPSLGINFNIYLDGLGLIFGLLITGIGALVILYSIFYMSKEREALHNFYAYLLIFMGAMLGVIVSDNVLVLYVFWELTSISSFLLIAYWYQRKQSRAGAQKAMLITVAGGLAMLAGLIMLVLTAETYSIREMINQAGMIAESELFVPAMILILIGAFAKSAQFPFHIWLPDAMEAPTPVSSYLHSATMVKAGIYLVARFTAVFGGSSVWFWCISIIGLITLIVGSVTAVRQTDLKALLAYSTISQLGLIMCLLGLGSASLYFGYSDQTDFFAVAVFAALFHLVNHATFKGCLFMVVGIIDHETGTRDIRKLGGLMSIMPVSFTLAIIGSFSMAGLPPFNGFLSKEMFFTGVLSAAKLPIFGMDTFGIVFLVIAWIASVFTFVYCMILVFKTFVGKRKQQKFDKEVHEAPLGMLISPMILATLVMVSFFFPEVLSKYLLQPAFVAVMPGYADVGGLDIHIQPWHGFTTELFMTLGVIAVGVLLFKGMRYWMWLYRFIPEKISPNFLYHQGIEKLESVSKRMTSMYMTGFSRDYLLYIFSFFVILLGGSLWLLGGFVFDPSNNSAVTVFEGILLAAMLAAALAVLASYKRLNSILSVGALGYLVAMFFVILRAPDLSLTQLVVETATTVLFLLCFCYLPEIRQVVSSRRFNLVNLIVSIGVGLTVTLIALSVQGKGMLKPISYFFEDSYELAGAKNMVNAILVDFRGFDTMLEIVVLFTAGLAVYSLIKLRANERDLG